MPKFKVGDLVSWWDVTVISNIHGYDGYMKIYEDKRPAIILSFTHGEEHYRVPQCYLTLVNRDAT
jgi:hypothetical protein